MLIGEGQDWADGVGRAWDTLAALNPEEVCRRTMAHFNDGIIINVRSADSQLDSVVLWQSSRHNASALNGVGPGAKYGMGE